MNRILSFLCCCIPKHSPPRVAPEQTRVASEQTRVASEQPRVAPEHTRVAPEQNRNASLQSENSLHGQILTPPNAVYSEIQIRPNEGEEESSHQGGPPVDRAVDTQSVASIVTVEDDPLVNSDTQYACSQVVKDLFANKFKIEEEVNSAADLSETVINYTDIYADARAEYIQAEVIGNHEIVVVKNPKNWRASFIAMVKKMDETRTIGPDGDNVQSFLTTFRSCMSGTDQPLKLEVKAQELNEQTIRVLGLPEKPYYRKLKIYSEEQRDGLLSDWDYILSNVVSEEDRIFPSSLSLPVFQLELSTFFLTYLDKEGNKKKKAEEAEQAAFFLRKALENGLKWEDSHKYGKKVLAKAIENFGSHTFESEAFQNISALYGLLIQRIKNDKADGKSVSSKDITQLWRKFCGSLKIKIKFISYSTWMKECKTDFGSLLSLKKKFEELSDNELVSYFHFSNIENVGNDYKLQNRTITFLLYLEVESRHLHSGVNGLIKDTILNELKEMKKGSTRGYSDSLPVLELLTKMEKGSADFAHCSIDSLALLEENPELCEKIKECEEDLKEISLSKEVDFQQIVALKKKLCEWMKYPAFCNWVDIVKQRPPSIRRALLICLTYESKKDKTEADRKLWQYAVNYLSTKAPTIAQCLGELLQQSRLKETVLIK
ncbi:hypothetical protein DID78_03990 [Candidatus Marinamargulisbacteria bacterium SCGC AG-343-D04]|nr:hypothetical protein DID78_03990 [Candidatus Marinamargulisbacteria bacterium SCGC AG-343-D04]